MTPKEKAAKSRNLRTAQAALMDMEGAALRLQATAGQFSPIAVGTGIGSTQDMAAQALDHVSKAAQLLDAAINLENAALHGARVEVIQDSQEG